jgi:hypothetical protein
MADDLTDLWNVDFFFLGIDSFSKRSHFNKYLVLYWRFTLIIRKI